MATAKKTPAKKATKPPAKAKVATPAKKAPVAPAKATGERTYTMPQDVKDWIERANSTINHLKGENDRLKAELKELKAFLQSILRIQLYLIELWFFILLVFHHIQCSQAMLLLSMLTTSVIPCVTLARSTRDLKMLSIMSL